MTALVWDQITERMYESGISRGVLYGTDGFNVAWNGLISVDQSSVDESEPLYFDGVKYEDLVTLGDFEGTLTAFTYPQEFLQYEGILEVEDGFFATGQPKSKFGLSYRTEVGSPAGQSVSYKIHILYNLTAIPTQRTYKTLSLEPEPIEFQWDLKALPEEIDGFRHTAHVIIDSDRMSPDVLIELEELLYGTAITEPSLPSLKELVYFVKTAG